MRNDFLFLVQTYLILHAGGFPRSRYMLCARWAINVSEDCLYDHSGPDGCYGNVDLGKKAEEFVQWFVDFDCCSPPPPWLRYSAAIPKTSSGPVQENPA